MSADPAILIAACEADLQALRRLRPDVQRRVGVAMLAGAGWTLDLRGFVKLPPDAQRKVLSERAPS
jgi:hypothetical protein